MHLGTSFITASKSVHYTVPVTSDAGENLWKRDYFSIVLPVYLQVAMERGTKDVSPVTTERERKIKIPNFLNFQILPTLPSPMWEGIKAQEIFQQKSENWNRIGNDLSQREIPLNAATSSSNTEKLRFSAASQLPFL